MKQSGLLRYPHRITIMCLLLLPLAVLPVRAQDSDGRYHSQELAQMLAPIALYPDALLSQILMASTYPIEVIEADRWLQRHSTLDDDDLDDALYDKEWDQSVKALCHFPAVLSRMSEKISETTNLGNAFLAQEQEVMEMVQQLRTRAYQEGNLSSTRQQKVIIEKEVIVIEPARSRVVYVPYYDPYYVYGSWWYPDYPPYYWGPSNVHLGFGVSFSSGISLSFVFTQWSYFDWHRHVIYHNPHKRPRFVRRARVTSPTIWHHIPKHRRGVAYRDKHTAHKYGQFSQHSQQSRRESRGYRIETTHTGISRHEKRTRPETIHPTQRKTRNVTPPRSEQHRTVKPPRRDANTQRYSQPRDAKIEQNMRHPQTVRKTVERPTLQMRKPNKQTRGKPVVTRPQSTYEKRNERENVFNRVNDGRSERQSSQRGKTSRQHQAKKYPRERK